MTNKEKFKDKMLDIAIEKFGFAVDSNGNVEDCNSLQCVDCKFYKDDGNHTVYCLGRFKEWLEEEYKELKIDPRLYNAPVDTKILVSNNGISWVKVHFCKIENGKVFVFSYGRTSFTCDGEDDINVWIYGKLWEEDHD